MRVYFDASALTALFLEDFGADRIDRWVAADDPDVALSEFTWGEFVSALGSRVRRRPLSAEAARGLLVDERLYVGHWEQYKLANVDLISATAFVERFELGLRLPDALHIALAKRIGRTLVTTDHQQLRAAQTLGVPAVDPTATA